MLWVSTGVGEMGGLFKGKSRGLTSDILMVVDTAAILDTYESGADLASSTEIDINGDFVYMFCIYRSGVDGEADAGPGHELYIVADPGDSVRWRVVSLPAHREQSVVLHGYEQRGSERLLSTPSLMTAKLLEPLPTKSPKRGSPYGGRDETDSQAVVSPYWRSNVVGVGSAVHTFRIGIHGSDASPIGRYRWDSQLTIISKSERD